MKEPCNCSQSLIYIHTYIHTYMGQGWTDFCESSGAASGDRIILWAQKGPERPREAQRGPERPREAQRGPQRLREAQRRPKRRREAQIGPERPREAPTVPRKAQRCSERLFSVLSYVEYIHSC